jgi:hypothetical protein
MLASVFRWLVPPKFQCHLDIINTLLIDSETIDNAPNLNESESLIEFSRRKIVSKDP